MLLFLLILSSSDSCRSLKRTASPHYSSHLYPTAKAGDGGLIPMLLFAEMGMKFVLLHSQPHPLHISAISSFSNYPPALFPINSVILCFTTSSFKEHTRSFSSRAYAAAQFGTKESSLSPLDPSKLSPVHGSGIGGHFCCLKAPGSSSEYYFDSWRASLSVHPYEVTVHSNTHSFIVAESYWHFYGPPLLIESIEDWRLKMETRVAVLLDSLVYLHAEPWLR